MKRLNQSKYKIYSNLYNKIASPYKEVIAELIMTNNLQSSMINIYYHQHKNKKIKSSIIDYVKQVIPECILNATCYRATPVNYKCINIDDLYGSVKKDSTYSESTQSWSTNKEFVDNVENQVSFSFSTDDIIFKLETQAEGIYIPKFWEVLKNAYPDIFENGFSYYDYYNYECELLVPRQTEFKIYNEAEIKNKYYEKMKE